MKRYKDAAKKFAEEIQIPEDAFNDTYTIEMKGNTELIIEGCKGIVEYSNTLITVNLGCNLLKISGDTLEIDNFFDRQVVINGTVISMDFSS